MSNNNDQLAALKQIELQSFKAFLQVCEKLNLRYYLLGGTLLGAVRHQGFIPWDDDIDIGMPRADYEIFLKKGQALLPEHLFLQHADTDPEYLMCYCKLRNNNTTFLETTARNLRINHGVFIDIFPLDFCPDGEKQRNRIYQKMAFYNRRISLEFYYPQKQTLKRRLYSTVLRCLLPSAKNAVQKRNALLRNVKSSSFWANYGGAWGKKEIMPACWYGPGVTLTFEGLQVTAPLHYEKWLTQVYGDYMQLPPVEKRVTHHGTDVIDLNQSYQEYIRGSL